jgi:homoserine kinase
VTEAPRLTVRSEGEGADLPQDERHLAARVAIEIRSTDKLAITVRSSIPVARGLGSSAALVAATALAAGADDPLGIAARYDGHGENAAASVLGGLVAAPMVDGRPLVRRLPLDPALAFVVVVPDRHVTTAEARAALPATVAFSAAVSNLGRLALLISGLADATSFDPAAGLDRLHQDARAALFPEAAELLARLRGAGALVACWSGAGPSLLAICRDRSDTTKVAEAGELALEELALTGRVHELVPDLSGIRTF